ncbi:MAG: RNase adapter RapZ, partial [Oxalobacteraceae bacterium]
MRIIIITGISGSGKSVALNTLEDAGVYCVDNLPPPLLHDLITTLDADGVDTAAIAIDARSARSFAALPADIVRLKNAGHDVKVLFLTAKTESLITRFSETRRSHPLSHRTDSESGSQQSRTLEECIREERETLVAFEGYSHVIDTSGMSASKLRSWISELIAIKGSSLTLLFESFAFKFGVPLDADLVFDVRTLPNPFYDINLRPLTGQDAPVIAFLDAEPDAAELFNDIRNFVEKWLPAFKKNNRSYLTVAIGCTGGQHRSVYIAERLAHYFQTAEHVV